LNNQTITMHKLLLLLFFGCAVSIQAQVKIDLPNTPLKKASTLSFSIQANDEVKAELAVFSNTYVVQVNEVSIKKGTSSWEIPLGDAPVGSYFLLIKGDKIHEQKSFVIAE
jgi:hypothetical protein